MSCSNCEPVGKGTLDNHKMLQENMRLLNRVVELEAENAALREQYENAVAAVSTLGADRNRLHKQLNQQITANAALTKEKAE